MGKPKSSKASGKALAQVSHEQMAMSRPAREAYFGQLESALTGQGSRIPILNTATSGAEAGAKSAMDTTTDALNKTGTSRFAPGIIATQQSRAGQTTAGIKDTITRQLIGAAPNASLGLAQQGIQGLQASATNNANIAASNQASQSALIGSGAAAAGAIAGAIIIAV